MRYKTTLTDANATVVLQAKNKEELTVKYRIDSLEFMDLLATMSELQEEQDELTDKDKQDEAELALNFLRLFNAVKAVIGQGNYRKMTNFARRNNDEIKLDEFVALVSNFNAQEQEDLPKGSES